MPQPFPDDLYAELHRLATFLLNRQRSDHTLQPTALVHEAYLRLHHHEYVAGLAPRQAVAIASRVMRQVLVDHARRRGAARRNGPGVRVPLDDAFALYEERALDIVALHEALERLAAMDGELAQIVELRFFGGLSEAEISEMLGCSNRTVRRHWQMARRWLNHELRK